MLRTVSVAVDCELVALTHTYTHTRLQPRTTPTAPSRRTITRTASTVPDPCSLFSLTPNSSTAIQWMTEFIALGGSHLQAQFSEIIGSVIHCISDSEPDIAAAAKNANAGNDTHTVWWLCSLGANGVVGTVCYVFMSLLWRH
jgi:hypothetical protein